MTIRDKDDRKELRECYHHIRGNHNDVSLVLWHGPMQPPTFVKLMTNDGIRDETQLFWFPEKHGGTLLTGDLTFTDAVLEKMRRHLGRFLWETAFLHVPHHGSLPSWNHRLPDAVPKDVLGMISAGIHNRYNHPHPQVIASLRHPLIGPRRVLCNERNPVAMEIEVA
jgi:hypothetical protein